MKRIFAIIGVVACLIVAALVVSYRPQEDDANSIRVIYFSGIPSGKLIRDELPDFQEMSGIKVYFEEIPYDSVRVKAIASLKSAKAQYDVMFVDDIWMYEFARKNYLHPLDDYIERDQVDMGDFFPSVREAEAELDGVTWLIPQRADVQVLFYRRDLFENESFRAKYKLEHGTELSVPETWEDYQRVAEFFFKVGEKENPTFYGTAETLKRPHFAFEFFAMRYWAVSGKQFTAEGDVPLFDTKEGVAAVNLVKNLKPFAIPGSANASHDETISAFSSGKAAMAPQWYAFYSTLRGENSAIKRDLGVAPVPGVRLDDGSIRRTPSIGGGSLGIASNSANKEAAWKFISHMTSKEFMTKGAMAGDCVTRRSAYGNSEVEKVHPDVKTYLASLEQAWFRPRSERFVELESAIGLALSQAFVGELLAEEALSRAATSLKSDR